MKIKKLMILGAGVCQVPIITLAKKIGLYTIVVSIDGNYPGFELGDKSYRIDVREKEKLLEIAKRENISGVLTDQTDISVPTVAYIADKMGLPGIGYDCALRFTNKYKMRQYCQGIGVQIPDYFQSATLEDAIKFAEHIGPPIILKPVDNQGSRGVSRVGHLIEFEEKFLKAKQYSHEGTVIIEKYISGSEVVVEGFASNQKFTNLMIGDSENFELDDIFIPKIRIFPTSLNDNLKKKVLILNHRIIDSLGLNFGITHSEFLVDQNTGGIWPIEIAARGGGVFISSDLIPLSCSIDVNELLIHIAMGKHVSIDDAMIKERASGYLCFNLPKGKIIRVDGIEAIKKIPGIHKVFLDDILVGSKTSEMRDKTQRIGPILLFGENRQDVKKAIDDLKKTLIIDVETAAGIEGIRW